MYCLTEIHDMNCEVLSELEWNDPIARRDGCEPGLKQIKAFGKTTQLY